MHSPAMALTFRGMIVKSVPLSLTIKAAETPWCVITLRPSSAWLSVRLFCWLHHRHSLGNVKPDNPESLKPLETLASLGVSKPRQHDKKRQTTEPTPLLPYPYSCTYNSCTMQQSPNRSQHHSTSCRRRAQSHNHACMRTRPYAHAYARTRADTRTHTYAHAYAHAHTHVHAHAHTWGWESPTLVRRGGRTDNGSARE